MEERRTPDRVLLRRVLSQARSQWHYISALLFVDLLATPLALLQPVPLKIAVDSILGEEPLPRPLQAVLGGASASKFAALAAVTAFLLLVVLLNQLQDAASEFLKTRTGENLTLDFQTRLFRHAQRLSLAYHDARGTTDSIYRTQYDAYCIWHLSIGGLLPFITNGFTLVAMIYVSAKIDWQLALVALIVAPALLALAHWYRSRARNWYHESKEYESEALEVVQEVLTALRVVKAFAREDSEEQRFRRRAGESMRTRIRLAVTESAFGSVISLTTAVGTALVLFVGVRNVEAGVLTLGDLLLVLSYLVQLYSPLEQLSWEIGDLQSSLASAERAFELLDQEPDVSESPDARPLRRARGRLEFRDVTFSYDGEHEVLRHISLLLEAGTKLGIAGRTGAGKTTLVNLAARFYDPTAGSILLDDVDLRDYRLADLRNQFGIVLQEPVLFSATIADNISYGRPGASVDEITEAAKAANAHDFITALPEGYDTEVGERGMRLSGGERQRIALARAFLKDAPILILDEPTSSVDLRTEALIIEAMERLMSGRTVLMIAHRLSTLENCDARIVVEEGEIVSATGAIRTASGPSDEGLGHDEWPPPVPALTTAAVNGQETEVAPVVAGGAPRLPSFSAAAHPSDLLAAAAPAILEEHPAYQAWMQLGLGGGVPTHIEPLQENPDQWARSFRLHGLNADDATVVAKVSSGEQLRVELLVHEEVLPRLEVAAARYLGVTSGEDGERWVFLTAPTGEPFDANSPAHRTIAMDWLALLHTRSSRLDLRGLLPERTPGHYLDQLRVIRERLRGAFDEPELAHMDRVVLRALSDRCDLLEWHWQHLEACVEGLPFALVHGRLGAGNAYVRPDDPSCPFLVLNWDTAGWGPPAADLQPLSIDRYAHRVRSSWRGLSRKKLTAAALAGSVFRQLDVMEFQTRQPDWLGAEGLERLAAHDRQLRRGFLLIGLPLLHGGHAGAR
ncbi:MAG: ABC transporter transmembrane domain-containing protein [Actinomycetota bacterium]|nr:ABC transporter transmembrane domain-containing protein [Actinomycetota bacterium]